MSRQTRTRLLTAGVLLSVFGAGVLLGFAADTTLTPPPASASVAAPEGEAVSGEPEEPRRTPMYEQVGPDSAQSVQIAALVQEHRARMDALNREFQENYDPRYRAIVEETREAIKRVFTPEQAARYQEIVEERDRRRAEEEAANPDSE
jgi:Spy/CpxP family protein refolding chaperone